MESRFSVVLLTIVALALFGGLFGIKEYSQLSGERRKVQEAEAQLVSLRDTQKTRAARSDKLRDELDSWKKITQLNGEKNALTKEIAALEERRIAQLLEYKDYVLKTRPKMEGKEFPELKLTSGKTFQGVRIQKVSDTDVTVSHSLGVTRVDGRELPESLQEIFRFGRMPVTFVKPADPNAPAVATTDAPPAAASSPNEPRFDRYSSPAMKIQVDIDALENRIGELQRHSSAWQDKARELRFQVRITQSSGRPTYNLNAQADQADKQSQACLSEISRINAQIAELKRKQIEAGTAKPQE